MRYSNFEFEIRFQVRPLWSVFPFGRCGGFAGRCGGFAGRWDGDGGGCGMDGRLQRWLRKKILNIVDVGRFGRFGMLWMVFESFWNVLGRACYRFDPPRTCPDTAMATGISTVGTTPGQRYKNFDDPLIFDVCCFQMFRLITCKLTCSGCGSLRNL